MANFAAIMEKKKLQGHAAVLLANVIFGLGIPVTKLLLDQWVSPMAYMATRCIGAAAIFWLISLWMPKEHVERRDLLVIMLGGLLGFVISQTFTAWALHYTSPVYFSVIATLTPVATMLCAALFIGERLTTRDCLGILLIILAVSLVVAGSASAPLLLRIRKLFPRRPRKVRL